MAWDSTTNMQALTGAAAFAQCQANFSAFDSAVTLAGIVTFSASPIVPTPTTDYQCATKKYVDDVAVALTGNQTVAGIKTFSSSPIVPTPTTDYQASTKKYVDDTVAAIPNTLAELGLDSGAASVSSTSTSVSFNFTFASAPKVFLTRKQSSFVGHYEAVVMSVTTTGFVIRKDDSDSEVINWIAIGTPA